MCVNECLHMCILFNILSTDCVCFMDFDIRTADGDLIVLVYIDTEFPTIFNNSCTYITFKSAVKKRQVTATLRNRLST